MESILTDDDNQRSPSFSPLKIDRIFEESYKKILRKVTSNFEGLHKNLIKKTKEREREAYLLLLFITSQFTS